MIQKTAIEVIKEGRSYQFVCGLGSPLGEMHDVLFELKEMIIQKIKEGQERYKKLG